jgi:hypothetical protein
MDSRYRLIPEEIPAISKATVYNDVMEDFLKRKDPAARVEMAKKKPSTIHQGLLKAKRLNPAFASVSVVRRGDSIYLRK